MCPLRKHGVLLALLTDLKSIYTYRFLSEFRLFTFIHISERFGFSYHVVLCYIYYKHIKSLSLWLPSIKT